MSTKLRRRARKPNSIIIEITKDTVKMQFKHDAAGVWIKEALEDMENSRVRTRPIQLSPRHLRVLRSNRKLFCCFANDVLILERDAVESTKSKKTQPVEPPGLVPSKSLYDYLVAAGAAASTAVKHAQAPAVVADQWREGTAPGDTWLLIKTSTGRYRVAKLMNNPCAWFDDHDRVLTNVTAWKPIT